jgi:guanylate kinase
MNFTPRLFVIVGTPGSGKDILIRAVDVLGSRHADVVPKHTSRARRQDDGEEMICPKDPDYDLDSCDIQYENYGDQYGIQSESIWEGFRKNRFQVAVVSDIDAIRKLQQIFGELMVLVYVHSDKSAKDYEREEKRAQHGDIDYVERRVQEYEQARQLYLEHFLAFNHVLISAGLDEDLYDQIFRLFRAYERGDLGHATARPVASGRIWEVGDEVSTSESVKIIIGGT